MKVHESILVRRNNQDLLGLAKVFHLLHRIHWILNAFYYLKYLIIDQYRSSAPQRVLLNASLLARNAKFLPVTDTMKLRSTCRVWRSEFSRAARADAPLIEFCWGDEQELNRFIKANRDNKSLTPFGNYFLRLGNAPQSLYLDFFSTFGHYIHQLSLLVSFETPAIYVNNLLRRTIFAKTPSLVELCLTVFQFQPTASQLEALQTWIQLPNLRSLKVEFRYWSRDEEGVHSLSLRVWKELIHDVIRGAARLEELSIELFNSDTDIPIWNVLRDLPAGRILHSLRIRCSCQMHWSTEAPDILLQLCTRSLNPLRLREVEFVECLRTASSNAILPVFLSAQSQTLQKLTLWFTDETGLGSQLWLPYLPQLLSLTILGKRAITLELSSLSVNFPNLKSLECQVQTNSESIPSVSRQRAHHPGIRCLKLHPRAQDLFLNMLVQFYPSVVELRLGSITSSDLGQLWTCWLNLKVLIISSVVNGNDDCLNLDSTITGIPEHRFQILRAAIAEGGCAVAELQGKLDELKVTSGITNMKELLEFRILYRPAEVRDKITEISNYFGFQVPGSKLQICQY